MRVVRPTAIIVGFLCLCVAAAESPGPSIAKYFVRMQDGTICAEIRQGGENRTWIIGCSVAFRGEAETDLPAQNLSGRSKLEVVEFKMPRKGAYELPERFIVSVWGGKEPDKGRRSGFKLVNFKVSTDWKDVPVGAGNPGINALLDPTTKEYRDAKQGGIEFVGLELLSAGAPGGPADAVIAGNEKLDVVAKVKVTQTGVYLLNHGIHRFLYRLILPDGSVVDPDKYFVVPPVRVENYKLEHTMNDLNIARDLLIQPGDKEVKETIQSKGTLQAGDYVLIVGVRARRWTATSRGMEYDQVYMRKPFRVIGR